ncbi:MAG: rhomboid family intramembrane serine protease [Actinomycetota bacterium]|nr:rhomboid family intramembrane serine protease [Actinomycetota bacterium]
MCTGKARDDAAGRATYRARSQVSRRTSKWPIVRIIGGAGVTQTIIGLNVLVLLLMYATGRPTAPQTLLQFGALPSPLPKSEWWRMITAMFVHIGLLHLLFNVWALMLFGPALEERYGRPRFLIVYIVSGISGSAFSLAFTGAGLAAGASGAVFGILGAWLAFFVRHRNVPALRGQLRSLLFLIGINLAFGATAGHIDNFAHVGGLVAGFAIGAALEWSSRKVRPLSWAGALAGTLILAAALAIPHMV